MFNRAKGLNVFWKETQSFACCILGLHWRAVEFDVGKFPEVCVDYAGGSLADEKLAAIFYDERGEAAGGGGGALVEIGKFVDALVLKRETMARDGTTLAFWVARGANERAEFHEGLVEVGAGGEFLIFDF